MERKLKFYEHYGVDEYYIYDPDNGDLIGWRRVGAALEEIPQMSGFVSPRLKIRFEPGEGPDNLKIFGPDGEPFLTYMELVKAAQRRFVSSQTRNPDSQTRNPDSRRIRRNKLSVPNDWPRGCGSWASTRIDTVP